MSAARLVTSSVSIQPRNHLFQADSEGGRPPVTTLTTVSPSAVMVPRVTGRLVPESIRSQMPTEGSPVAVL